MSDVASAAPPASQVIHRPTLRSAPADATLDGSGYVIVDFWGAEVAARLREAYLALVPSGDPQLAVDYMRDDRDLVRRLQQLFDGVLEHAVDDLFVDHEILQTTFVTKHQGLASTLFLHDDLTAVDERVHRSVTIWAPLDSVGPDIENGGLEVVADSHRLPASWGGTGTPDLIRPYEDALRARLERPAVESGQALLYDSRLLHASSANETPRPRVAVVCRVIPSGAAPIHVRATGRRHRQVYGVDRDFFIDHHPHDLRQAMPERCPLLWEYDEEARLRDDVVAALVRGSAPSVVVPLDVRLDGARSGHLPPGALRVVAASTDVPSDLLAAVADSPSPEAFVSVTGAAEFVVFAVRREGTGVAGLPSALEPIVRGTTPGVFDVDVVLLGAGARASIPAADVDLHAAVFDAPQVGAGACVGGRFANLDLGSSFRISPGAPATIWNDGPGPLTLVVGRPRPPQMRSSRFRRVRSRRN